MREGRKRISVFLWLLHSQWRVKFKGKNLLKLRVTKKRYILWTLHICRIRDDYKFYALPTV